MREEIELRWRDSDATAGRDDTTDAASVVNVRMVTAQGTWAWLVMITDIEQTLTGAIRHLQTLPVRLSICPISSFNTAARPVIDLPLHCFVPLVTRSQSQALKPNKRTRPHSKNPEMYVLSSAHVLNMTRQQGIPVHLRPRRSMLRH